MMAASQLTHTMLVLPVIIASLTTVFAHFKLDFPVSFYTIRENG
jgi:hypothetical protein